jgi:hypothetical protein
MAPRSGPDDCERPGGAPGTDRALAPWMRILASVLLVVVAAGCQAVATDSPDVELERARPGGQIATAACASDPADCLYAPATYPLEPTIEVTLTDPDRIGGPRDVPIAIRYSLSAPRPMPVVIWSHGGATGKTNPTLALDKWAIAAAEAGYLSIAIAHEWRADASLFELCAFFEMDRLGCSLFKHLNYDRPLDISLVIDEVTAMSHRAPWRGRIDATRIAVGGHSAGAGGTLMIDGAPRDINHTTTLLADSRPMAFLAFSPQAPGSEGFTEDGYGAITRPTLIGTGRGDEDPPDTADGRASVFDLVQPGEKYRIFIEDAAAIHTIYELETGNCALATPLVRCEEFRDWLQATGLAFLDAFLRGDPDAQAWLASTDLEVASAGTAEWSTR